MDLYKKVITGVSPEFEVMSSVDRDMVHVYHGRNCDPDLPDDQHHMCIGAWSETLASHLVAGTLYLNESRAVVT